MLQFALPVFLLMLGAAFIGFLISWAWRKQKIDELKAEVYRLNSVCRRLEQEQANFFTHSNNLQAEQEKWIVLQQKQEAHIKQLTTDNAHLRNEKELLLEEYNRHRLEFKGNKNDQHKLVKRIKQLNALLHRQEDEIGKWKEKYDALMEIKVESDQMLQKLHNYRVDDEKQTGQDRKTKEQSSRNKGDKKKKWKLKYKTVHFKLLAASKERDEIAKALKKAEKLKTQYELALHKVEAKETALDKVKDQFRKWTSKNKTNKKQLAANKRLDQQTDLILDQIHLRKIELDFDRIGTA
ncbi:MAG: hypothetical protein AAF985_19445, partial [Bacteroidota bacterium]